MILHEKMNVLMFMMIKIDCGIILETKYVWEHDGIVEYGLECEIMQIWAKLGVVVGLSYKGCTVERPLSRVAGLSYNCWTLVW